ncbi:hypothetical protein OEIGOIKO_06654 [Streptomyces chrestomyceticus JCM 4735]|uniref:Uncharacterized protein n=1 Tax=Streptomyces chrestomyceticus JCM 4735 TaxID=1306181 RepID=A0A7U9L0K1_9ACTN|nr:hypothetical protein [Streptomyces chrestomyceticus]GCD38835.1 hypothetical protein OEIGOIKO_06654 [Streptomyces chrestomyceticus JCM 4735]
MKTVARVAIAASVVGGVLVTLGVIYLWIAWGPGRAEPGDVVGTWSGPRGAQVTLRADGSATATKLPGGYSGYHPAHTFSGTGTWTLPKAPNSAAEQTIRVEVVTGPGESATVELVIDGDGARDGIHVPVSADSALGIDFGRTS